MLIATTKPYEYTNYIFGINLNSIYTSQSLFYNNQKKKLFPIYITILHDQRKESYAIRYNVYTRKDYAT